MSRARMDKTFSEVFLSEFAKGLAEVGSLALIIPNGLIPPCRKNPVAEAGVVRVKRRDSAIDLHTHRTMGGCLPASAPPDPAELGTVSAGTSWKGVPSDSAFSTCSSVIVLDACKSSLLLLIASAKNDEESLSCCSIPDNSMCEMAMRLSTLVTPKYRKRATRKILSRSGGRLRAKRASVDGDTIDGIPEGGDEGDVVEGGTLDVSAENSLLPPPPTSLRAS